MAEDALFAPGGEDKQGRASILIGTMGRSLSRYWDERASYQTLLCGVAALLLASGATHGVVYWIDGGPWEGPLSWRKPIMFGFSFGVTLLAVAWVLSFLPRRRVLGWVLAGALAFASVGEVFLISMQTWRGVPSHFNEATPIDAIIFSTMGALVVLIALVIAALTLWSFTSLRASSSMRLAILTGLVSLLASQALGGLIIANGMSKPDAVATASTFGAAGAMKVPHAVTLHAIQLLPALAWLLAFTAWPERHRLYLVLVAAGGYGGVFLVVVLQTFSGLPTLQMNAAVASLLTISVLAMTGVFAATLWRLATGKVSAI